MPTREQVRCIAMIGKLYGMKIPTTPVCRGHTSPGDMIARMTFDRPLMSLDQGPRGGGKSLGSSLSNYLLGQMYPEYEAKILGGSMAQSEQIYRGMDFFRRARPEADAIQEMLKTEALFRSGAHVQMLTASEKSVRGPHVPQLCLDEVDEIDDEIREHSFGMVMRKGRLSASISMTSTWHRVAGPMAQLMEEGRQGAFPVGCFCMFDVLERCPVERSGPNLEGCPDCPLMKWCHADKDQHNGVPKAKRSCGHYDIDALIQKTKLSERVFRSDYLCEEPRPQGQWFTEYDDAVHCQEAAEYDPNRPFHVAIDPGVCTGAVWFQTSGHRSNVRVNAFGDYYAEGESAERNAAAIIAQTRQLTGLGIDKGRVSMDPASKQRNAVGPAVYNEYLRVGCRGQNLRIDEWPYIGPGRPKTDTLQFVEALLQSADGSVSYTNHPRCTRLREAFKSYVRARSPDGQWLDDPLSPQHPFEEPIDCLAGGLSLEYPEGRKIDSGHRRIAARDFL